MRTRALLIAEFLAVFVALPVGVALYGEPIPLFPVLWLLSVLCLAYLWSDRGFDRRRLWSTGNLLTKIRVALLPFLLIAPLLAVWSWLDDPSRFLGFVRRRPTLWALVMVLYPVLSVYPQGVIYRAFIFRRYRAVFGGPRGTVVASALAFGAAHVIFLNWVAPTFGFAGGLLFAWTYHRSGSALVAALQHAAFGCWLFTVGLGIYFYYGAVRF